MNELVIDIFQMLASLIYIIVVIFLLFTLFWKIFAVKIKLRFFFTPMLRWKSCFFFAVLSK